MSQSFYAKFSKNLSKNRGGAAEKQRLMDLRKAKSSVLRLEKPSNLSAARRLGYKAKQGYVVALCGVHKGGAFKTRPNHGRRPKAMSASKYSRKKSHQSIAEERVARKYPNLMVVNSYLSGDDGVRKYFEVILVNPSAKTVSKDKEASKIVGKKQKGRAFRGKTSAGRKSRGLHKKGKGSEKNRPSIRANLGKGK